MKQAKAQTYYFIMKGAMLLAVDFVFAIIGLIGFVLPADWGWAKIAFGLVMVGFLVLIDGMFGYSESFHGSLLTSRRQKIDDVAEKRKARAYAVWKGFMIPLFAVVIQFILLTAGVASGNRGLQVVTTVFYSGFSTFCVGIGAYVQGGLSILTPQGIGLLALLYIPMLFTVLAHGIGYWIGGMRKNRLNRELDADSKSYDR